MKKILALLFVLALFCKCVQAAEVTIGDSLENTDFGELEELSKDKYDIDIKELAGKIISGDFDSSDILDGITALAVGEVEKNKAFVKRILLICVLNGIIAAAAEGFIKNGVERYADFAACGAAAAMLAAGYRACASILTSGASEITDIMHAAVPLILCIVTADSGGTGALAYTGVLSLATGILDGFVRNIIVPQITFSVMLSMLNCMWERSLVGRLSQLLSFLAVWELRLCAFAFVGCLTLGRIGAAPASAAVGKGVRLAVGAVPVVGGLFENSLEAVAGFVSVLKGGAAAAVIVVIAVTCMGGLIKLAAVMLMYKLTAALAEPMGSKKITAMTDSAAEGVSLLTGAYFTLMLMFISAVSVMLGSFS